MLFKKLLTSLAFLGLATASAIPKGTKEARMLQIHATNGQSLAARQSNCANTPTTRSCWSNGFDISTDSESSWPVTGVTVAVRAKKLHFLPFAN